MALIPRNNNNTNTNTAAPAQQQQVAAPQIKWPTTAARSNGNGYINQCRAVGQFRGSIKNIRPLQSQKDSTVFAVIDIEVPGKVGMFQDYLHFNPAKEAASISFLVNRTKAIAASAGYDTDENEEHDINWVRETIEELVQAKAQVAFIQERVERGLDIQYL